MIIYSDNTAKSLILENVDQGYLARVYSDLGLSVPDFKNPDYLISLKDFVTYFRVLYSVTYLNKTMSEKALRLLTETEFKDGIAAGLPPEITVAHKFGERGYPNGTKELHDCGIVYLSKSPYLLGVMTKGRDFDILKDIVKDISRIVYRYRSEKGLRMY
jgi:beta-lactamase class A